MNIFHQNIDILIGLLLAITGISIFIFPPKFGNVFYGVTTKWTIKNDTLWAAGQKLFAASIIIIGLVFIVIGSFKFREDILPITMVILLIGLWNLSKYIVHKVLKSKYPGM